jgi:DNA-binding CsgD family transcriptional regulator
MRVRRGGAKLLGRRNECVALDRLVATVQSGQSAVLVIQGEAGIGKTALLEYLASRATGCRILTAAGVESEMELAFGGLHQLCAPLLDKLAPLPAPQRDALGTAFGLKAGEVPDRFLVGLAELSLLANAAEEKPLLCVVDDTQWLDRVSAQTLAFVARRLLAEPIGLVMAMRDSGEEHHALTGLPHLEVGPLSDSDARLLFRSATPWPLDVRVRDRIVAEAHGNPLALIELPRGLTSADRAGGFERPDVRPLSSKIEQSFLRRIEALPIETRRLLLVAAADPVGDVALFRQAADRLGIDAAATSPAEADGLLDVGTRVRFRHPLVRSAAYRTAATQDRRSAHRVLAEATDPQADPDRRAWHLANAATFADEAVAADLERSAERAHARGGAAAAAAFLARAVELTPDPARRGARALAAARAKHQAGAFEAALELLDAAKVSVLDDLGIAQASLLRGQIMFASRSASAGLPLLITAAKQLEPLDSGLARATYRDAFYAALTAGRLSGIGLVEVATAARTAPQSADPSRTDLLLDGLALVTTEGYAAGVPTLKRALVGFRAADISRDEGLGWLPLAARMAHDTWDFETWTVLSARLVELARETGALSVLPSALLLRLSNRVFAGDLVDADSLVAEATTVGEATGNHIFAHYGALVLEAWRGREEQTTEAIEAITQNSVLRGEGKVTTATQWAAAVLFNGLGRYEEAYGAAEHGAENPKELGLSTWSLIELIEAATRTGRSDSAAEPLRRLNELAIASGTDWAMGILAGCRALVSDGQSADALYREAIERLSRTDLQVLVARAHLNFGEWLRRENRRRDARTHLHVAHDMLSQMGAEAFADRARRELQATGETVRERKAESHTTLTGQEAQIARLARDGLTNPEIGTRLFLSPHTIEWHLRKVYTKLDITSRRQLSAVLPDAGKAVAAC